MKIEKINVSNEGYIHCNSCFYSSQDSLSIDLKYDFSIGINKLVGEIDSSIWAISYLLSMYRYRPKDFILFQPPEVTINNSIISLDNLSQYSCYLDKLYPLFSTKDSVRKIVSKGLNNYKSKYSADEIRNLFHIDSERFERSLTGAGNEAFKIMSAIGYSYGKQVYCFPWMSKKRFEIYNIYMEDLFKILEGLKGIIILPVGE